MIEKVNQDEPHSLGENHLNDGFWWVVQSSPYSTKLGHVPIIDDNPHSGEKKHMDPATKARFAERSTAERVYSDLKDNYGGSHVRVKGASKVMTHLMFGLVAIAAKQIIRLIIWKRTVETAYPRTATEAERIAVSKMAEKGLI